MKSCNCFCKIIPILMTLAILAVPNLCCHAAGQTIFHDDFPSTTINPTNWVSTDGVPTIDDVGLAEPSLPYSLRLNGDPVGRDAVESRSLNLSGMAEVELTYWYQRTGGGEHPDLGEDLIIECWDGSTWVELDRQLGDGSDMTNYNEVVLTLPIATYNTDFKLRISNIGTSGDYDDWFVDDVSITIPDDFAISPPEGFSSSGDIGGPFTPPSRTYTLTNVGSTASLDWTAQTTASWLDVDPNSGTLLPGGMADTVTIAINSNANLLATGAYTGTVTFTNVTSGIQQTRQVTLQVGLKSILAYIEYADTSVGGEYQNTLAAIDSLSTEYVLTELTNYTELEPMLAGCNVLLIPEQEDASSTVLENIGMVWAATLQNFVTNGGVVIQCDNSGKYGILTGAGLMSIASSGGSNDVIVTVTTPTDPVAKGVPATYMASNGSSYYDTTEATEVVSRPAYGPVVINKQIGYGHVVLIGHDYYSSNSDQDRIVANAVFNLPAIYDDLLVSPIEAFLAEGYEGGPFWPLGNTYTITNIGTSPLDWTISASQTWLDVTPSSGTLNQDDSNTVQVYFNTEANSLVPDVYTGIITFTNVSNGVVQTRDVELTVNELPPELAVVINKILCPRSLLPDEVKIIRAAVTLTNVGPGAVLEWQLKEEESSTTDAPALDVEPGVRIGKEDGGVKEKEPPLASGDYTVEGQGGPDPAGYTFIDSHEPGGPTFDWIEISGTGTNLNLTDDSHYFPIDLPFAFDFYGTNYTQAAVCSNGTIYFEDSYLTLDNVCIPATADVGRFIALYWDDLYPDSFGNVYYEIVGSAPNRILVVQFENVSHYDGGSSVTAQAQLFERGGEILLLYSDPSLEEGSGATVGIQGDFSTGLEYSCNSGVLEAGLVIRFSRGISWVEAAPNCGTLSQGQAVDLDVTFDTRGLPEVFSGQALLAIYSNAPNSPAGIQVCIEVRPDSLEVLPKQDFEFTGHPGGPFVPTYNQYHLTNIGPIEIEWQVEVNEPWLDVSPANGTLQSSESTILQLSVNQNADLLPEGDHYANLMFTNTTTTVVQNRSVLLDVYTEPKAWANPLSFTVSVPQYQQEIQALTIGNTGDSPLEYSLSVNQIAFTELDPCDSLGEQSSLAIENSGVPGIELDRPGVLDVAPDRLLVRFKEKKNGIPPGIEKRNTILSNLGGPHKVRRQYKTVPGLCIVDLAPGVTIAEALESFNRSQEILYAEPDYRVKANSVLPDDPLFGDLWGLHNTGQSGGLPGADVNGPEAWDISTGSSEIVVAVIDTGVDYTHPDLSANMWINEAELNGTPGVDDDGNGYIDDIYGYDFCNDDADPMDDHYHGTHCAGTIGAVGNNGLGVVGVCWNVKIMALKFLDAGGYGWDSDAIDCIEYSILMGANLSSNSWGGDGYSQALKDAIDAAGAAGMLFVAAAGNDNENTDVYPHYPSSYDSECLISVMSTQHNDNKSGFSNWGPISVDLGAPGSDILSCEPGNRYQYLDGTSMAAPHVSGACALLWSISPVMPSLVVKNILLNSVDSLPSLNGFCVSGGRLNVHQALLQAGTSGSTDWLQFQPATGTILPGQTADVNVIFNGEVPAGVYEGIIKINSNDPYVPEIVIPVTMTAEPIDYFTELFDPSIPIDPNDPNCNDIANRTLTFRPDGLFSYYKACISEANDFPVDPTGSTIVSLGDDDYIQVDLLDGAQLNFYGHSYETFYIGSNGYVSFISGDIRRFETLADHFDLPRISALFDDLDPSADGTISWKQLDDRVVVTFEDVPEYGLSNSNSFQIEMRFNGKVRITLLDIAAHDGLVGLSGGDGLPDYFIESDLSEYNLCTFRGDLNGDQDVDLVDFAIFGACWQNQNDDMETVRDEFNAVSYSSNNGTRNWSNDWQEWGESDGPSSGFLQVVPEGSLRLGHKQAKDQPTLSLTREADLTGATIATLSYDYVAENQGGAGFVNVQVSGDGGSNWNTLATYYYDAGSGFDSFDITPYVSHNTQIRFEIPSQSKIKMYLYVDNIQIQYNNPNRPWYPWCNGADFSRDFRVNFKDLQIFVDHWLE